MTALLISLMFRSLLLASVGTMGSSGEVPYVVAEHKYTGEELTFTLEGCPQDFEFIAWFFSTKEGLTDLTAYLGEGAYLLPDEAMIFITEKTVLTVLPPPEYEGETVYIQAVVKETAPNGNGVPYTISRPMSLTFTKRYDLSNLKVEVAGWVPHAGALTDLQSRGDLLFAASEPFGLAVFRTQPGDNPELLSVLGSAPLSFDPTHVAADDTRAVITGDSGWLALTEVSPTDGSLSFLGETWVNGFMLGAVAVYPAAGHTYAYCQVLGNGMVTLDVTDFSTLSQKNQFLSGESVVTMGAYQDHLYLFTASGTGYVYDLALGPDPAAMKKAVFPLPEAPKAVAFQGERAFVLDGTGKKVMVFHLPSAYGGGAVPVLEKTEDLGGYIAFQGITAAPGWIFLHDAYRIQSFQVDGTLNFTPGTSVQTKKTIHGLSAESGLLYAAFSGDDNVGIRSFQIPSLQMLDVPSHSLRHDQLWDVVVVEVELAGAVHTFACLLEKGAGVHVVRVDDPEHPVWVNTLEGDYSAIASYRDHLVYARADTHEVVLCRPVSLDGSLEKVGSFTADGFVKSMAADGDYLFVAQFMDGMTVVKVGDTPDHPEKVAAFNDPALGGVYSVSVANYLAYLTGTEGVVIVDVTQRDAPELQGQVFPGCGHTTYRSDADGFVCFLPDWDKDVAVLDTRTPWSPEGILLEGTLPVNNLASDVAIHGNLAVVAEDHFGTPNNFKSLVFYELGDAASVQEFLSFKELPGFNPCVAVHKGYVYAGDEESLLDVVRLKEQGSP